MGRQAGISWDTSWLTAPHWRLARTVLGLFAGRIACGEIEIALPGLPPVTGSGDETGPSARLRILRARALRRLAMRGAMGLAEAYMEGDWDTPDLAGLLEFGARNEQAMAGKLKNTSMLRLKDRIGHARKSNTKRGSRRNIAAHYDLGNEFYAAWLDPSMSYSAGLFDNGAANLDQAQAAKYQRLAEIMALRPGLRVLEIGCGWGAFAELLARDHGCHVTAITLSEAQHAHMRARIEKAGLDDKIDIRFCDYRDLTGRYDRIVSIEMFEAVGEAHWPVYFGALNRLLTPGGIAALQLITISEARFARYRRGADFIQRYIFPGGMLAPPSALDRLAAGAGLTIDDRFCFGESYARTLNMWAERFERAWPDIAALGFDDRFRRMWRYYLAYCAAGFRTGAIDVMQLRLRHAPQR